MKIYECFDEYTKNKINEEVKGMVKEMEIEKKEGKSYFKVGEKGDSRGLSNIEGDSKVEGDCKGLEKGKRLVEGLEKASLYPTPYPTPIKDSYALNPTPYPTPIKDSYALNPTPTSPPSLNPHLNPTPSSLNPPTSPHLYPTPLSRITAQELPDQFLIISTNQINNLNKLLKGIKGSKAIVFCGTGWKDSIKYLNWIKEDGRVIKKGIEIHYIPYSEHSSSDELKKFKEEVEYERIVNTVKNKGGDYGDHYYGDV